MLILWNLFRALACIEVVLLLAVLTGALAGYLPQTLVRWLAQRLRGGTYDEKQ